MLLPHCHCTQGDVTCLLHGHTSDGRCGCTRLLGRRELRGMAPGGRSREALRSFGGWGCCVRALGCAPISVVVCILHGSKIHLANASGCGCRSACAAEGACCGCQERCEAWWARLRRPAAACGKLPVCNRLQLLNRMTIAHIFPCCAMLACVSCCVILGAKSCP